MYVLVDTGNEVKWETLKDLIPTEESCCFFCELYKVVHAHCKTTRQKSILKCKEAESSFFLHYFCSPVYPLCVV